MAAKPKVTVSDPVAEFGAQLLREDPELRNMARELYRTAMAQMLRDLKAGTPALKLPIYRLLIPSIMKEATVDPEGVNPGEVAAGLHHDLMAALIGQTPAAVAPADGPVNEGTIGHD